jgi:hypothetical protein
VIDRKLPGPVAQPFNVPTQRTLWLSGETPELKFAIYVSQESDELVAVVQRGSTIVREVASMNSIISTWVTGIGSELTND